MEYLARMIEKPGAYNVISVKIDNSKNPSFAPLLDIVALWSGGKSTVYDRSRSKSAAIYIDHEGL